MEASLDWVGVAMRGRVAQLKAPSRMSSATLASALVLTGDIRLTDNVCYVDCDSPGFQQFGCIRVEKRMTNRRINISMY